MLKISGWKNISKVPPTRLPCSLSPIVKSPRTVIATAQAHQRLLNKADFKCYSISSSLNAQFHGRYFFALFSHLHSRLITISTLLRALAGHHRLPLVPKSSCICILGGSLFLRRLQTVLGKQKRHILQGLKPVCVQPQAWHPSLFLGGKIKHIWRICLYIEALQHLFKGCNFPRLKDNKAIIMVDYYQRGKIAFKDILWGLFINDAVHSCQSECCTCATMCLDLFRLSLTVLLSLYFWFLRLQVLLYW